MQEKKKRVKKMLVRPNWIKLPRLRIEVKPGPMVLCWLKLTPMSELPTHMRNLFKQKKVKATHIWYPALNVRSPEKGTCRVCNKKSIIYESSLCMNCFELVSRTLCQAGLLTRISDYNLNRILQNISRFVKFMSRFGRPKIWVLGGRSYGVVPGREKEFFEMISRLPSQGKS